MTLLELYNIPNTTWFTGDRQLFRELNIGNRNITISVSRRGASVELDSKREVTLNSDGGFKAYTLDEVCYTLHLMRIIPFTAEHTLMLSLGIKEEDLCEP